MVQSLKIYQHDFIEDCFHTAQHDLLITLGFPVKYYSTTHRYKGRVVEKCVYFRFSVSFYSIGRNLAKIVATSALEAVANGSKLVSGRPVISPAF